MRVPLQVSNNVQSFVYTVSSVCLQPFTETLVEVQCPRSFAGHDGLIEPISTNQFKHYAVSRSLCHPPRPLTDCKAVVRIMNIKPHAFVIRKGERVGTIENIDVKTQCNPFIDTEDTSLVAKSISRREQPYDLSYWVL